MSNITFKKSISVLMLSVAVTMVCLALVLSGAFAGEKPWSVTFDKVSGHSALGQTSYRGMQGIGFDTYSGEDGYVFMQGEKDHKGYFMLSHFKIDDSGFCTKTKATKYSAVNVGHANDATVYQDDGGRKWLLFAPCGTYGEDNTAKASDGTPLKLGAILLNGNGDPTATVYSCDVSELQASFSGEDNKGNITGVTYKGKDLVNGELRPIFIVMNAKAMYEAYVSISGNTFKFMPTGKSGRIEKPLLPSGGEAATQGIAYHNNYIYITGEGYEIDETTAEAVVARIAIDELFGGSASDYKDMEVFKANRKSNTVTKHGPEAAFFTSLNDKSHLYIGLNRTANDKDDDWIVRSRVKY